MSNIALNEVDTIVNPANALTILETASLVRHCGGDLKLCFTPPKSDNSGDLSSIDISSWTPQRTVLFGEALFDFTDERIGDGSSSSGESTPEQHFAKRLRNAGHRVFVIPDRSYHLCFQRSQEITTEYTARHGFVDEGTMPFGDWLALMELLSGQELDEGTQMLCQATVSIMDRRAQNPIMLYASRIAAARLPCDEIASAVSHLAHLRFDW